MAEPNPTPTPEAMNPLSPAGWSERLQHSGDWFLSHGVRIVLIVIALSICLKISRTLIERSVKLAIRRQGGTAIDTLMLEKRRTTLISLFQTVAGIVLVIMAGMMVFDELGFAIGPLLASAGIAGAALAFGAQSLVKDIITGAFIIVESQYSVGDVIQVGGLSGAVEEINLRTTVLRGVDGGVHIVPNGQIAQVTVLTRDWSRLVLDLDIGYGADIRKACDLLQEILEQYAAAHPDFVIEPPEVQGVQALGESSVQIRGLMKMLPGKQWPAGRQLREQIKNAFDEAGIEIPFPQRTLWIRNEPPESAE